MLGILMCWSLLEGLEESEILFLGSILLPSECCMASLLHVPDPEKQTGCIPLIGSFLGKDLSLVLVFKDQGLPLKRNIN